LTLSANSSIAHTASATKARRATSFATSVVSQPLPLLLILSDPTCTDAVYQLKNTLISRMNAPPAEIQTDRGTAAKSKLAAGDDDCGAAALDSAAGGGGGGGGGGGDGDGSGSGSGSGACGGGSGAAEDSVGAGSGVGSGVGSGPASSPAVGSLPSVLMEPPFRSAIPRLRSR
jgi:hypothetical protein